MFKKIGSFNSLGINLNTIYNDVEKGEGDWCRLHHNESHNQSARPPENDYNKAWDREAERLPSEKASYNSNPFLILLRNLVY